MADKQVTIRFEGRLLTCRADTSVAVALWEHGVRQLSHSPKYGQPRGVTCARGQCTACLMRVDGVPNVRTCETPVREGMEIRRQDAGAVYGRPMQRSLAHGSRFFPVGFYFKWFTRPAWLSRFFLRMVRPLAGIGRIPDAAGPETGAPEDLGKYDTVVVGGGRAGLSAAAAADGRVLLVDENETVGGHRAAALAEVAGPDAPAGMLERFGVLAGWHADQREAAARLSEAADVTVRRGCRAVAGYRPDLLLLRTGDRLATVRAGRVVWAAGAMDSLGLFPGNDIPGVIGPRALYRLLTRDGLEIRGRRVLLIGGGLDFWLAAALLSARGAALNLVVEESGWQSEVSAAVDQNWQLTTGLRLSRLEDRGGHGVRAVFVPRSAAPGPTGSRLELDGDLVVVCQPGKPTYDIPYQLGAALTLDPARGGFVAADNEVSDGLPLTVVGEAAGEPPARRPAQQVSHE